MLPGAAIAAAAAASSGRPAPSPAAEPATSTTSARLDLAGWIQLLRDAGQWDTNATADDVLAFIARYDETHREAK